MAYIELPVKPEKFGVRDADISERHRLYGASCSMVDLDFVVIEYYFSKVVALIEYKYHLAENKHDLSTSNYKALIDLADRAGIPFFVVYYDRKDWSFNVYCSNQKAKDIYNKDLLKLDELSFVKLLYQLRDLKINQEIEKRLNNSHQVIK